MQGNRFFSKKLEKLTTTFIRNHTEILDRLIGISEFYDPIDKTRRIMATLLIKDENDNFEVQILFDEDIPTFIRQFFTNYPEIFADKKALGNFSNVDHQTLN